MRHTDRLHRRSIRQQPVDHHDGAADARTARGQGPLAGFSLLNPRRGEGIDFYKSPSHFTWLNPHLTLTVDWFGERSTERRPTRPGRSGGRADPTSPHWYTAAHLERLIAAYVAHDADRGRMRTVREFVAEFRGLSGTAKQKAVLGATGWRERR